MAKSGASRKPDHLKLIEGTVNVTKDGSIADVKARVVASIKFGRLRKPRRLQGEAAIAWRRYIAPAAWLDAAREPIAIAFCRLWQEFQAAPEQFTAGRHAQMRAYLNELGLTDERNRVLDASAKKDEFFD